MNTAPAIPDLTFRQYEGVDDFKKMLPVMVASTDADQKEHSGITVDLIARQYARLTNSDPYRDTLFAEVNGDLVGYGRCFWEKESSGKESEAKGVYLYNFVSYVLPEWRKRGLGETMLHWFESRLGEIATTHPDGHLKFLESTVEETQAYWETLIKGADYQPVRYFHDMVCSLSKEIPSFPLLAGLEVRPATADHYRAVWDSDLEAFQDEWGFVFPAESDYQYWISDETFFQPHLWQIAWDVATGEIAGQVQAFIDPVWNEKYGRQEGFIGPVSVRAPWRRKGVAKALLTRSLKHLKAKGMIQCKLHVDSENPNGATHLYTSCGFQVEKRSTLYRKPL